MGREGGKEQGWAIGLLSHTFIPVLWYVLKDRQQWFSMALLKKILVMCFSLQPSCPPVNFIRNKSVLLKQIQSVLWSHLHMTNTCQPQSCWRRSPSQWDSCCLLPSDPHQLYKVIFTDAQSRKIQLSRSHNKEQLIIGIDSDLLEGVSTHDLLCIATHDKCR